MIITKKCLGMPQPHPPQDIMQNVKGIKVTQLILTSPSAKKGGIL